MFKKLHLASHFFCIVMFLCISWQSILPQEIYWRKLDLSNSILQIKTSSSGELFALSNYYVYRSEDNGNNWVQYVTVMGSSTFQIMGLDELLIGTNDGRLYHASNGGAIVKLLNSFGNSIHSILYAPIQDTLRIVVGTNNGFIHFSTDGGTTWSSKESITGYLVSLKFIQDKIFVVTYSGLYYSNDVGQTWQRMIVSQTVETVFDLEHDSEGNLYCSIQFFGGYGLYKSNDSGNTWLQCLDKRVKKIGYSPEGEIFAYGYRSTNGGSTWNLVAETDFGDYAFKDSITFVIAGNIYREEFNPYIGTNLFPLNMANRWLYLNDYWSYSTPSYNGQYAYKVVTGEVIGDTIIDNNIYYQISSFPNGYYRLEENKVYQWLDGQDKLFMDFSVSPLNSFNYLGTAAAVVSEGYMQIFNAVKFYKESYFREFDMLTGASTQINFGDSVGIISRNISGSSNHGGLYWGSSLTLVNALVQVGDSLIYYSYHEKPQISITPGTEVNSFLLDVTFYVNHSYSKFSSNGLSRNFIKNVWIDCFYKNGDSIKYRDSIAVQVDSNSTQCHVMITLDSTLMLQNYKFCYSVTADDRSIFPEISRVPETGYFELVYNPYPSGTEEDQHSFLFSLEPNYPNPFNPTTTIKYSLAQTGRVMLSIYDLLGREVVIIVDEEKPAGDYETVWNASTYPSGVYFLRMQSGQFSETRKLILMK